MEKSTINQATVNRNQSGENSLFSILKAITKSVTSSAASSAFLKTGTGKAVGSGVYQITRHVVNDVCNSEVGKRAVSSIASGLVKKSVAGAAARTVCSSALKGNAITAGIGMLISSFGDAKDYANGQISGTQCAKNIAVNAAGVGGGIGGWSAGAAAGSIFGPLGTIAGGIIGSFLGSSGASAATKGLLD